jgi:hypothetical protein
MRNAVFWDIKTMKNCVFWDVTPCGSEPRVETSQKTQFIIVTAVKTSNPTYKNHVRTSQETHYVSATEFTRLMLCKI